MGRHPKKNQMPCEHRRKKTDGITNEIPDSQVPLAFALRTIIEYWLTHIPSPPRATLKRHPPTPPTHPPPSLIRPHPKPTKMPHNPLHRRATTNNSHPNPQIKRPH